jgi:hypothetical protein
MGTNLDKFHYEGPPVRDLYTDPKHSVASSSTDPQPLPNRDLSREQQNRTQAATANVRSNVFRSNASSEEEEKKVYGDNVGGKLGKEPVSDVSVDMLSYVKSELAAKSSRTGRIAWLGAASVAVGLGSLMSGISVAGGVSLVFATGTGVGFIMATGGIGAIVIGLLLLLYALSRTSD